MIQTKSRSLRPNSSLKNANKKGRSSLSRLWQSPLRNRLMSRRPNKDLRPGTPVTNATTLSTLETISLTAKFAATSFSARNAIRKIRSTLTSSRKAKCQRSTSPQKTPIYWSPRATCSAKGAATAWWTRAKESTLAPIRAAPQTSQMVKRSTGATSVRTPLNTSTREQSWKITSLQRKMAMKRTRVRGFWMKHSKSTMILTARTS